MSRITSLTVVNVNTEKRFGFARTKEVAGDVFFHFDDLPSGFETIRRGAVLQGVVSQSPKGFRLSKIEVVQNSSKEALKDPFVFFALASVILWAVTAAIIYTSFQVSAFIAVIIGLNVAALMLMGFDKSLARSQSTRIPEVVLYSIALIGGSPGVFLGMHVFRHKTRKAEFNFVIFIVIAAQIFLFRYLGGGTQ